MAYGDIIEYNGEKYRCINPDLTSNTTPAPYYANASNEYIYDSKTGCGHAYCPFVDRPQGITGNWNWVPGVPPIWVGLFFGKSALVDLIIISANPQRRTMTIYGSNDAVKMETLKVITHESGTLPYYVEFTNKIEYSYYRIAITDNENVGWTGLGSVRFYQKMDRERYLLNDNGLQTIKNGTAIAVEGAIPTQEVFQQKGFEDIQLIKDVSAQLSSVFNILCYSKDELNTAVQIKHVPEPQLIVPIGDIDLSAYSTIKKVTLTATGSTGQVRLALSFDKGNTWKTYSDGWQDIAFTTDALMTNGITPETLSAIAAKQWAAVKTNTLRVAYCLHKTVITDDIAVDSLSITGDTASWVLAGDDDYTYNYPDTKTIQVKLLADGSFKINYMETK